jgi:protein phosphatase
MGGARSGEVASRLCVKSIVDEYLEEYNPAYSGEWLKELVQEANRFVHDYSIIHTKCSGMGTTSVVLLITEDRGFIANVGDSRLYRFQDKKFKQITEDDSMIWAYYKQGKLKKEQLVKHPSGHVLTKAIGLERMIDFKIQKITLGKKELFLLCSDGLTDFVTDKVISTIITENESLEKITKELINKALNEGSNDDISIILLSNDMK